MTNRFDLLEKLVNLLNPTLDAGTKPSSIPLEEKKLVNELLDAVKDALQGNCKDLVDFFKGGDDRLLLKELYKYCKEEKICRNSEPPLSAPKTQNYKLKNIYNKLKETLKDKCCSNNRNYSSVLNRMKKTGKIKLDKIKECNLPILDTCYSSEKAGQLEKALEELHSRLCGASSSCCDKFAKFLVLLIAAYATASIDPKRIREIEWFLLLARAAAGAIPGSSNDKYLSVCPYIGDAIAVYYYYVDRGCSISKIQPDDVKDIIARLVNL